MDVYNLYQAVEQDFEVLIRKLSFYKFEKKASEKQKIKLVLPTVSTSDGDIIPGIKKINGLNCTFFTQPNCSIYHNRPLACRNYPFTFLRDKTSLKFSWAKNAEKTCPGIGKGEIVDVSYIKQSGDLTLNSLSLHKNLIQELNTEVDRGNPLSAREVIWMFIIYGEKIQAQK